MSALLIARRTTLLVARCTLSPRCPATARIHTHPQPALADSPPVVVPVKRRAPTFRPSKAAISLTSKAVDRLRGMLQSDNPQLIRIGVKNKGCAGMSYHLDYVDTPAKFDEIVEQDGVRVLIDSKALFSIIGSEMDWTEDELSSKFTFKNPNIKDECGCGESFTL